MEGSENTALYWLISIQAEHETKKSNPGDGQVWQITQEQERFKEQFLLAFGRFSGSEDTKANNLSPFTSFTGYWKHRGVSFE